jgi:hypothetical protein
VECRLRLLGNRVLGKIFEPMKGGMKVVRLKLLIDDLSDV